MPATSPTAMQRAASAEALQKVMVTAGIGLMISLGGDELLRLIVILGVTDSQFTISLGLIAFLAAAPALAAPLIGHAVDRMYRHPRLLVNVTIVSGMLCTAILWAIWKRSGLQFFIYPIIFVIELAAMTITVAWQSFVPEFAPKGSLRARRIVARTSMILAVGPLLGPAAVALLAPFVQIQALVLGDTISFIISIPLLQPCLVRLEQLRADATGHPPAAPALRVHSLFDGVGMVLRSDLVRAPLCVLSVSNACVYVVFFALPILGYARSGDTQVAASLTATELLAGLVGAIAGGKFHSNEFFRVYVSVEPLLRAIGLIILAAASPLWALYAGTVIFAFPQGIGRIGRLWFLSQAFNAGERGRANGGYRLVARFPMVFLPAILLPLAHVKGGSVTGLFYTLAIVFALLITVPWVDTRFGRAIAVQLHPEPLEAARS